MAPILRASESRLHFLLMLGISTTDRVFVLTGAGVSAESGIPTFRGVSGLWRNTGSRRSPHPRLGNAIPGWSGSFTRCVGVSPQRPSRTQRTLRSRSLTRTLQERLFICTQNVDDLHEQAGSRGVIHMHGELFKAAVIRAAACPSRTQISMSLHASFPGANAEAVFALTSVGLVKCRLIWIASLKHWTTARCLLL